MTRIQLRRGTADQWRRADPILAAGEPGFEVDTFRHKVGDGQKSWSQLPTLVLDRDLQSLVDERVGQQSAVLVNPAGLGRWWAACTRSDSRRPRVVFLGSSTTQGAGASTPERRWPHLFVSQLQAAHPSGGREAALMRLSIPPAEVPAPPGIQGFNGANAGQTSANYCVGGHLYGIGVFNPTLVVHMIGSNDSVPGSTFVSVSDYRANVEAALDAMRTRCHLLVHTYRRFETSVTRATWAEYGQALRDIALSRDNVAFVDLSGFFEEAHRNGDPSGVVSSDAVHPSDAGHALIAQLLARSLVLTPAPQAPREPEPDPVRDSGWRTVTPSAGWRVAGTDGVCSLRRVGDRVTARLRLEPTSETVGLSRSARRTALELPAGFRPPGREHYGLVVTDEGLRTAPLGTWTGRSELTFRFPPVTGEEPDAWQSGDQVVSWLEWSTGDGWPDPLPGSAT